jgi:4-hydroxy-tetrahydrodipicolinate synthase
LLVTDSVVRPPPVAAFVSSITVFDETGALDEKGFRAHLNRLGEAGIGVYVAGGGSGEAYAMSHAERRRVLELGVEVLKDVVPIRLMGVEPRTAEDMIDFATAAVSCGVDAVQIYSIDVGHGGIPTDAEIASYFTEVLENLTVPCILSTHGSGDSFVPVTTLAALAHRFDHLIEINCTRDDLYLDGLIDALHGEAGVFVGTESQSLTAFAMGASGYLSSIANLAPRTVMEVVNRYNVSDFVGTTLAYAKLMRLARLIYTNGGVRMTKELLRHFGLPGGYTRKPRLPLPPEAVRETAEAIRVLGIDHTEAW